MSKHRLTFVGPTALGMLLVVIGSAVSASQKEDIRFDAQYKVGNHVLEIKGTGILRYLGLVKAYAGALYALPAVEPEAVLEDTPKRLEVEYFVSLKGTDFGPATYRGLSRNLNDEMINRLRDRIDYHNSLYVDVRPGDRYALTYDPGRGTELSMNGKPLGVIQGADFASAIFSLWLGDAPLDRRFKRALLGMDG